MINAPLVYNGDIVSVESFERIREIINEPFEKQRFDRLNDRQSVNQFMLGRGILANPFLAEEIKNDIADARGASPQDKTERLHAYVIDLYETRLRHAGGSPKVLGRMKELWSYLMNSFDEPQNVWRKIKKLNSLKEYEDAVEYIFTNNRILGGYFLHRNQIQKIPHNLSR